MDEAECNLFDWALARGAKLDAVTVGWSELPEPLVPGSCPGSTNLSSCRYSGSRAEFCDPRRRRLRGLSATRPVQACDAVMELPLELALSPEVAAAELP